MMKYLPALLLILLSATTATIVRSQCNPSPCSGPPMPFVNAMDACVLPAPSALDCYYGATFPSTPVSFPPSWCTTIENNHFFAFVADAPVVSFDIAVYGCAQGGAIQAAILATSDCVNFTFASPCLGNIPTNSQTTLTSFTLTPGETYYLMIDGSAGAFCDYSINASLPTVNGPDEFCLPSGANAVYTASTVSVWTIDPPSAGVILGNPIASSVNVTWLETGDASICAQSTQCPNAPNQCLPVHIGSDVFVTEDAVMCEGYSVECGGNTYTKPGTYTINLQTFDGCDSVIQCKVSQIPTVYSNQTVLLCQGGSTTCAGEDFSSPGTYPVMFTSYTGCDSIVRCTIKQVNPSYAFKLVTLCGPADYSFCGETESATGQYTGTCVNYLGCDSIVTVDLAILQPEAIIEPPGVLDCTVNTSIVLDGSNSPTADAPGALTTYVWTGPGIVGLTNQPTVTVNQPGDYCLVVRHSRQGVVCTDTACVTVTAFSAVPQLPVITGDTTPCAGDTILYTAASAGNPPPTSFTWTTPGNHPYTSLSSDSILIAWGANSAGGNLCVRANNSCGSSQPSCVPISVLPQPVQPVMSGPTSVCADGGPYLYTLDTIQAGTNYVWSVPAGAVLTGSGDSVLVDFSSSVSGNVCVLVSNICDTLPPVCIPVQVNPVPSAALGTSAELCVGESTQLTFTLSGNGPFDVIWFDGTTVDTLLNITSGHTLTVNPSMHTTYYLIGVIDNSTPACTAVADDTVQVNVWPHVQTDLSAAICAGDSILLGGAYQTTAGTYLDTLLTVHGCDSVLVTVLTVNPIDTTLLSSTTCDPLSAGVFTNVYAQANGCDSVVTSTVTLLPSDSTFLYETSCIPANVGVFVQNLTNQWGCDSTVVTDVAFAFSDTTLISLTSCNPPDTGVYVQVLTNTEGCDSTIITTVSFLLSDTTYLSGSDCNPANVGVFENLLTNQKGCDSLVITTITFFHLDSTFLTDASCDPAATGVFYNTIVTADGCDSVIVTTVNLLQTDTTYLTGSDCNPANVGTFYDTLTNQFGCDSLIVTTVSFFHLDSTFLTDASCDPAATGVYYNTIVTAAGCDSVIVTTVNLLPTDTTYLSGADCNPANVGTFYNTLTNMWGCDSLIVNTVSFYHLDSTFLTAADCDPAATGVFYNTIVTSAGCDSVIVTTVNLLPSDTTYLFGTSCNTSQVGVFPSVLKNQYNCDSLVVNTVSFVPIDTTYTFDETCVPSLSGVFTQTITTAAGCDSTVVNTVSLLPSDTTVLDETTCVPSESGVFTSVLTNKWGCDSTVTRIVALLPSDTTYLTATTCEPGQVGTVLEVLTNQWDCDSLVYTTTSLLPISSCSVVVSMTGDTIPCLENTGSLTITVSVGEAPATYTIKTSGGVAVATGTIGAIGAPVTVPNIAAGNYTVEVSSTNGYSNTAQATIVQLYPPELWVLVASDYGGYAISCIGAQDGSAQAGATGGTMPYTFNWSTGETGSIIEDLSAGTYSVTVTDVNDCFDVGSVVLTEPDSLQVAFAITNLDCFGNDEGTIVVNAVGGTAPYSYVLNGGNPQTSNAFNDLDTGVYQVTVIDANDCSVNEIIVINAPVLVDVDLGDYQTIFLGDETTIEAIVNIPFDSLISVIWWPVDTSECPTCPVQAVAPVITTTYSISVIAANGCRDEDNTTVVVDRRRFVYAPNVFTPGGSDNNLFRLFAKPETVNKIKSFQVYDRWGESVHVAVDLDPYDLSTGWDGSFRGEPLNPGVYVWYAEIEFIDGVVELYKGDVTIVR